MPEIGEVIGQSDTAGRPAAGIAGRLWDTTDASPPGIYRDDGTDWQPTSGGGGLADPMTTDGDIIARIGGVADRVPKGANDTHFGVLSDGTLGYVADHPSYSRAAGPVPSTGWTSVNGSGAAYQEGGFYVSPGQHNGNVIHARVRAGLGAGSRNYRAFLTATFPADGDEEVGIVLNDSGSGKFILFSVGWDSAATPPGPCYRVSYWDDFGTWVSEEAKEPMPSLTPMWLVISEGTGSRSFMASMDGRDAGLLVHSTGSLDHITTQADRVGWAWNPNAASGSRNMGASLVGWLAS